jgi:toxin FitB
LIVLDTNVLSETLRAAPSTAVLDWLDRQPADSLHLTSVTVAEMLFGIGCLPDGRRRSALGAALDDALALFEGRMLPFCAKAARRHAAIAVRARAAGRGFPVPDGYIAAIADAH